MPRLLSGLLASLRALFSSDPAGKARVGLVGVILLFLSFGVVHSLVTPHLVPFDERAHASYAWYLGRGQLPELDTRIPHAELAIKPGPQKTVWLANHPPLYYALVAPFMWLDDPLLAVRCARLFTLCIAAAGIVYVFAIARLLLPRRPAVWVAAAALATCFPGFVHVMGLVHNDALAFLTGTAVLHAGLSLLIDGPSSRKVALLSLWAALACATRFSGLFASAVALLAGLGGFALWSSQALARRARGAALLVVLCVSSVGLSTGWYYARNVAIYGDVTGSKALMKRFKRRPSGTALSQAMKGKTWLRVHDETWARFSKGERIYPTLPHVGLAVLLSSTLFAIVEAVLSLARRRDWRDPRVHAWLLGGLGLLLHMGSIFAFVSRGGLPHARYVFPALWFVGLVMAVGLGSLRKPLVTGAIIGGIAVLHHLVLNTFAGRLWPGSGENDLLLVEALARNGVSGRLTLALSTSACALGLAILIKALIMLERSGEHESLEASQPAEVDSKQGATEPGTS